MSNIDDFCQECNVLNKTEGMIDDDIPLEKFKLWKFYKIEREHLEESSELNLFGQEINYSVFKYSNDNEIKKQLIVIPGFSKKSICWTLGRINFFLDKLSTIYSDICIFNLEDLKKKTPIITQSGVSNYDLYTKIGYQLNKVIKHLNYDNISLIGRSAGGALALIISSLNDKVNGLNLACPGYEEAMITDFINSSNKDIPVVISWSKEDTKIPLDKGLNLEKKLEEAGVNVTLHVISTGKEEDKYNHRIQQVLIDNLV